MASTGFWPVKSRLKEVIDYANNPDKTTDKKYLDEDLYATLRYEEDDKKTDQTMYVSAINCPKQRAYQCMMTTKQRYGKFGGNVAYHGYQSFKRDEVTPDEAHQIGIETAKRMWNEYEVVVTTHLNTDNIHNHIVVNSVSFKTGRKFENHVSDHYKLREISDLICEERGKSVLPPSKFKGSSKKEYWIKKNGGLSHRDMLRKDIDSIIKNSTSWTYFKENLKGFGYEIVRNNDYKHISVKAVGWKRSVRLDSLGANYTIDAIERRMEHNFQTVNYAAIYQIRKSPLGVANMFLMSRGIKLLQISPKNQIRNFSLEFAKYYWVIHTFDKPIPRILKLRKNLRRENDEKTSMLFVPRIYRQTGGLRQ